MKKTLLFIIILFAIISCDDSVEIPLKKQEKLTTVEILNNVDSTLQVSIVENKDIYVIKNGVTIANGYNDNTSLILAFILGLIWGFFIGIIPFNIME
jgi:hypothetical protein